jgi:hypothetical protein
MVKNAIVSVNTEEERMIFADESLQNQDEFLDSLSSAQFQKITNSLPKDLAVVYKDNIYVRLVKKEFKIELRGMDSFF